ncbi:pilus assembly protein [Lysobacter sp. A421]
MSVSTFIRFALVGGIIAAAVSQVVDLRAADTDYAIAQKPLYMGVTESPLMMMVMSRDERLFTKAYSDYSDLDEDGILDTTYQDGFDYSGYFDSGLCYSHTGGRFKASGAAAGTHGHSCSTGWSGNFVNWMTMSRLDVLRYVLYGGMRSTDDLDKTIIERAHIPDDLHAWVKVYSGGDIGSFTPLSGPHSFCSASFGENGAPTVRYKEGNWSEWAATATNQCGLNNGSDTPKTANSLTVRVEVCDPSVDASLREDFCTAYNHDGETSYKPTGLIQQYGESGRLRFGLISGSYDAPRSGGVLRRNIGRIAGNGAGACAAGDEVNLSTGQFCNQGGGDEGIINTVNRFKLTGWTGSKWSDCGDWGILNRQGQGGNGSLDNPGTGSHHCGAWGNPVAEMYAEAVRYIAGQSSGTSAFFGGGDLAGLPTSVVWNDPYRAPDDGGNSYCADCSILVLSSGLSSFDSDEMPSVPRIGSVSAATDAVGAAEGIVGGQYLVGRASSTPLGASLDTHADVCSAKAIGGLSSVRGICPDIPSLEGSYLVSGLAFRASTVDLRPGLQSKPAAHRNTVTTYGVALADNLPKFDIPLGSGKVSLAPLCQAHGNGNATLKTTGWRTCALGSVGVGSKVSQVAPYHVYGRPVIYDAQKRAVAGSFSLVWEDSLWGNDNDNDVVSMMTYCVGAACSADTNPRNNASWTGLDICWRSDSTVCGAGSPSVADDEVLVRIENMSAYAGNAMLTGVSISGSNQDGVHKLALRPGNQNGSILTTTADPAASWDKPKVMKLKVGSDGAGLLENPLWYAAKYGGFDDANNNGIPDSGEWDSRESGTPDNYFFARNPSELKAELGRIFEDATAGGGPTAGGGAGARVGDASFTLEAGFDVADASNDWTGFLRAIGVNDDGSAGAQLWDAAGSMPAPGSRQIWMSTQPTLVADDGAIDSAAAVASFTAVNLGGDETERLSALGVPTSKPSWLGSTTAEGLVSYLRGETVAGLRTRTSRLGDIVNSTTEIVTPRNDYGYGYWVDSAPGGWKNALGAGYRDYLAQKNEIPMVYVGANDGMLHGFNASEVSGGGEIFGFIPSTSLNRLFELANPSYEHQYYVDGQLTSGDVSFSSSGAGDWHTVLVGSTGGGGGGTATPNGSGSVFALDVSSPESFDANDVLWELSGANDADLGFVLGKPEIVPVEGIGGAPRWVALFGNGPNSDSGQPVLFVVDIETGEVLSRLAATDASYAIRNGLMNIAPVAIDNTNGLVDTVYAGDLQGNLWKFDLSSANPDDWQVGLSGVPLFTAADSGVVQPITGGLEVSTGPGGGMSIFFGTGSYFAEGDNENMAVQSLYSVWDDLSATPIGPRESALVEQMMFELPDSNGYSLRGVTREAVNYVDKRGWYLDLRVGSDASGVNGERFIGTPRLQSGKVIFTTYEPRGEICSAGGGVNWEYALDLLTGGGAMSGVSLTPGGDPVCTENCGGISLNDGDNPSAPVKTTNVFVPKLVSQCDPADPACTATIDELLEAEQCTFVLRAAGADPLYLPRPCGRQSWRQVR